MINIFFTFLLSAMAFSSINVGLQFHQAETRQGEIVEADVTVKSESEIELTKLNGQNIGKTVYIFEINQNAAKIIFAKKPESNSIKDTVNGQEVVVQWNDINVQEVKAPEKFLFGQFEVPSRPRILFWMSLLIGTLIVLVVGRHILQKMKQSKLVKEKRKNLKNEMIAAKEYEGIVEVWKKKTTYLEQFPEIQDSFHKLEATLFKYQFKSRRSEEEIRQVMEAYREFSTQVEGVLRGV